MARGSYYYGMPEMVGCIEGVHGIAFQVTPTFAQDYLNNFEPPKGWTEPTRDVQRWLPPVSPGQTRCPCGFTTLEECDGTFCGYADFLIAEGMQSNSAANGESNG